MAVVFTCACNNLLRTHEAHAGRSMRCPRCSQLVRVPVLPSPLEPAAPRARRFLAIKPGLRRSLIGIGGAAVAAAVIVAIVAACFVRERPVPPPEREHFSLIPMDGCAFLSVRVADTWKEVRGRDQENVVIVPGLDTKLRETTGLPLDMVERISYVLLNDLYSSPVVIVTATEPLDEDDIVTRVAPDAQSRKHEGVAYHFCAANGTAVHFVNQRTYAVAREPALQEWLTRIRVPIDEGPLKSGLERARRDDDFLVAAVSLSADLKKKTGPLMENPPLRPVLAFRDAVLAVKLARDLAFEVEATYANAEETERTAQFCVEAKTRLHFAVADLSRIMPEQNWWQRGVLRQAARSTLNAMQISHESRTVHITARLQLIHILPLVLNAKLLPELLMLSMVPPQPLDGPERP